MEKKYYAISNPIGCLLYYLKILHNEAEPSFDSEISVWVDSQVNGNESTKIKVLEKYKNKFCATLECILTIFTDCGWQLFYVEPLLRQKLDLLQRTGLINNESSKLQLTTLGFELFSTDQYNGFTQSITEKAEYWKYKNVKLYNQNKQGIGSGFFVSKKEIATCRHVVDGLNKPFVIEDENGVKYTCSNIKNHSNTSVDLAIIEICEEYESISFILGEEIGLLEKVCVFGYPPIPLTTRPFLIANLGEISSKVDNYIDKNDYLILSCIVKPGNSGGPVINEYGKVIGIVTQNIMDKLAYSQVADDSIDWMKVLGYSAAIPVKYLKEITA